MASSTEEIENTLSSILEKGIIKNHYVINFKVLLLKQIKYYLIIKVKHESYFFLISSETIARERDRITSRVF